VIGAGADTVYQIAPAPDGSAVCAGHSTSGLPSGDAARESDVPSNSITLIDAATLQVGASFVVPDTEWPGAIAVAPDSQTAFVLTTALNDTVHQVNLPQMTLAATIATASDRLYRRGNHGRLA
jgi:DNA-binding beta-propeller fold protein YncE